MTSFSFRDLPEKQWYQFCDVRMSEPVPLAQADVSKPFVYERQYGLFYVPFGKHSFAMSFLLALQMGCEDGMDAAEKLGVEFSSGTADHWLQHTPGAAFRSSVGKEIQVATAKGLTVQERRLFAPFCEVFKGVDPSEPRNPWRGASRVKNA